MAKTGRPKIQIDQSQFEKLCAVHCTLTDIAGWFRCSVDTVERWCQRTYATTFAECYKKYSAPGNVSLRRKQFEVALQGNVGMLIWLGKIVLGQRDTSADVRLINEEIQKLSKEEILQLMAHRLKAEGYGS